MIFAIHRPTEDAEKDRKDGFYERPDQQHDKQIVMGDFNVKLAKEEYLREVVGRQPTRHNK